jgi:hypothetical protein
MGLGALSASAERTPSRRPLRPTKASVTCSSSSRVQRLGVGGRASSVKPSALLTLVSLSTAK